MSPTRRRAFVRSLVYGLIGGVAGVLLSTLMTGFTTASAIIGCIIVALAVVPMAYIASRQVDDVPIEPLEDDHDEA